jgi:hypothetical protein
MNFVKLILRTSPYKIYQYKSSSDAKMLLLGHFLITDVGCSSTGTYQDWALNDPLDMIMSGNCTYLEKDENFIVLSDLHPEVKRPTEAKMTHQQFVQLLDDWQEKVCKHKPKEVTITYDGNQFTIETSDV